MSVKQDTNFHIGEDITLEVEVTTTGISGGPAVDITGWAISFSMKRRKGGDIVLSKTVGSGITITDGPNGRADIVLTDDDTNKLVVGEYDYDVKRTDPGSEAVVTTGTLTIKDTVTA